MHLKLLVSPLARGAYFAEYLDVALAELSALFAGLAPQVERVGSLDFIDVEVEEEDLPLLARASFLQGIFEVDGGRLLPLEVASPFVGPDDLVYGAKYQGKTNEVVTQLAINLALRFSERAKAPRTLLDPMAGKGTTLLWALRYGLKARGIERNRDALDALHRHIKKQTKLHRIKHRHSAGFTGKRNRNARGKFVQYEMFERSLQLITGDSREAEELLGGQRFDVLVTDLPYGVQFKGDKEQGNLLDLLRQCAPAWVASVGDGGAIVLVFNTYQPKRDALIEVFTAQGCQHQPFEAPHRMSESIVRDLLVFT